MFAKIVKYTLFAGFGILAVIFAGSFVAGYVMGRDIATVKVGNAHATRDTEGIWQIKAPDRASLWNSFGYLQAHDRYFQIELVRHAALGRLSELMGEKALGRDRLGRTIAAVAYEKFQTLAADSIVVKSAESFVQGVQKWRKSANASNPVEFKFLGIEGEQLPAWEPWHVYAISMYQSWLFSHDLSDEVRDAELRYVKGDQWTRLLNVKEASTDESYLYSPDAIKKHLHKPASGFSAAPFAAVISDPSTHAKLQDVYGIQGSGKVASHFGRIPIDTQLGASNAWLGFHPKRNLGPILCNDPHLHMMWPSSLYPIKYEIKDTQAGDLKASGWMLPGQPFLLTGALENHERIYAWGVTLANYANVQDRVPLAGKLLAALPKINVKFKVRDPRTYQETVVSFDEKWSPWGPVASEWFDHDSKQSDSWAIDWIGFRGAEPPYQYFIERNFDLSSDTPTTLASQWQMPVVNMHWITKDKMSKHSTWGHMVTGMIYSGPVPTASSHRTAISTPRERDYYSAMSSDGEIAFVASGNQQVWKASESARYADQWGSPLRPQQILNKREENFNTLGFSQTDDHSLLSYGFVKWARKRLNANKLCVDGTGTDGFFSRCQQNLSQLDAWDGSMDQSDWRPSLVSLWLAELKWRLWITKDASSRGTELTSRSDREISLFVKWGRSGAAQKLTWDLFNKPKFAADLKKQYGLDLDTLVKSSFAEAYTMLETSMGTDRSLWAWGNLHRVAWQHPLLALLGPNLPFVGPAMSGTDDSPLRASAEWDPRFPLLFPVVHGAVARSCYDASGDHLKLQWTSVSGPSGNPFSRWSQTFSQNYYFVNKWVQDAFFSEATQKVKSK